MEHRRRQLVGSRVGERGAGAGRGAERERDRGGGVEQRSAEWMRLAAECVSSEEVEAEC